MNADFEKAHAEGVELSTAATAANWTNLVS